MNPNEIILALILALQFFLPGCAILLLCGLWQKRPLLQQLLLSSAIGVATYPVLFYLLRGWLVIGRGELIGYLLLSLFVIVVHALRGARPTSPDGTEWIAAIIFMLTFLSRFQFAHNWPFPAWSDSLHHTLLTQLTAEAGHLPTSLEPFFPNLLNMYHLGLYAISGSLTMLSGQAAHLTLLWSAQFLNAMCGFGVYLILDRYVGRVAAITGAAVAGLFSVHPALWGNWGRFTQLSSVVMLPVAWLMVQEMLDAWAEDAKVSRRWVLLLLASLTTAAVFLLHFRVAIFFAALLLPLFVLTLVQARGRLRSVVVPIVVYGVLALLLIMPVLLAASEVYLDGRAEVVSERVTEVAAAVVVDEETRESDRQAYYGFSLEVYPYLVAPVWLLIVTAITLVIGLLRRHRVTGLALVWSLLMIGIGNLYLLQIPVLNVTNLGAILIMLYLPIALIVGVGADYLVQVVPTKSRTFATNAFLFALLAAAPPAAYLRATRVEQHRHFMTADDVAAMAWINENVPEDARFAINSFFWFSTFAHGTDAGYWIPYWTGREITTSSMLSAEVPPGYMNEIRARSNEAESLETSLDMLDELYEAGVEYIYIGSRGDFESVGLQRDFLEQSDEIVLLFDQGKASIFKIEDAAP